MLSCPWHFLRVMGLTLLGTIPAMAEVQLAHLFSDGMVLQRGQPIRVWGTADAGETVRVEFATATATTVANGFGRWQVTLPAQPASAQGRELRVQGQTMHQVQDVLVGDVWICAGQSNMEFEVQQARNGSREVAEANEPRIRQVKIARRLATEPIEEGAATPWRPATPAFVGHFTAVGYFFARERLRETNVPVGLINCTWSGTSIEPWMSAAALSSRPEFAVVAERWRADLAAYPERRRQYEGALRQWENEDRQAQSIGEEAQRQYRQSHRKPRPPAGAPDHPYPGNPSAIHNGMVHPLRHAAIRGVLWYQGEANAVRASEYAALFQASIRDWRATFSQPRLPFLWAQIANFEVNTDWPRLREAQSLALALPDTGQAVTIDIGDARDIHPANKQDVGKRLALLALALLDQRPVEATGPRFADVSVIGERIRVSFTHASGLHATEGAVRSLELAGGDRTFHPAEGIIEGEYLFVSCPAVTRPVAVRYAWSASPQANLYNGSGLPAAPFRSDAW